MGLWFFPHCRSLDERKMPLRYIAFKLLIISVRIKILMAKSIKMIFFCDVKACSLVETDRRLSGSYYLHHEGDDLCDDGDSNRLRNIG